jgi:hypothetical protein
LADLSHVHAFIREVRLTEKEWSTTSAFLTDCGHITDEHRQEFVLLSDVLGASMQTIAVNNQAYANATEATVFGPFFVEANTVRHRLRRIEKRTGRSLSRPRDVAELCLLSRYVAVSCSRNPLRLWTSGRHLLRLPHRGAFSGLLRSPAG